MKDVGGCLYEFVIGTILMVCALFIAFAFGFPAIGGNELLHTPSAGCPGVALLGTIVLIASMMTKTSSARAYLAGFPRAGCSYQFAVLAAFLVFIGWLLAGVFVLTGD